MQPSRVTPRLWLAAAGVTILWLGIAHAHSSFSDSLPELDRIYYRSGALSTLALPFIVTLVASVWPRRSAKRSLTAYVASFALAVLVLGQSYWRQVRDFPPERLEQARKRRQMEIIYQRQAEHDFEAVTKALQSPADEAPSPSSSAK